MPYFSGNDSSLNIILHGLHLSEWLVGCDVVVADIFMFKLWAIDVMGRDGVSQERKPLLLLVYCQLVVMHCQTSVVWSLSMYAPGEIKLVKEMHGGSMHVDSNPCWKSSPVPRPFPPPVLSYRVSFPGYSLLRSVDWERDYISDKFCSKYS